jgi:hypothetical protein
MTECNGDQLEFHALGRRAVVGKFDGGMISSDGGGLLLAELEARSGILARLAMQFTDHCEPAAIEHTVRELMAQRVFGLALGYEDLNDHDRLRLDPLVAVMVGKGDPSGGDRLCERDKGKPLASASTLNRLELTPEDADARARYIKIVADPAGMDRCSSIASWRLMGSLHRRYGLEQLLGHAQQILGHAQQILAPGGIAHQGRAGDKERAHLRQ